MGTLYLVDGNDLTSVANAIRAKSGGSSQLAFPAGFVSEIQAIPSGGGGGSHNLPSGYTELEYIEGTGTQYINTGYVPTADTEIICTFMRTASQSYDAVEFGVTPTPKAIAAGSYWGWGNAPDKHGAYHPDEIFGPLTIRVNISGVYNLIGAKAVNFGTVTWTSGSLPIYLLARNNGGNADRLAKERLYHWAAYENGTKMVEFIPALRRSDNALGMYETVSGTFFTNAGSGVFTGGAYT